jgi:uncharacterized protein HemY
MANSLELMKEKFDLLPEDAQQAIRTFGYDTALQQIHKKYKLHIDQSYSLEQLIAMVIFGEIRPQSLIPKIQQDLRLDKEKSEEMAFDVNNLVLKPIQELMKNIQTNS